MSVLETLVKKHKLTNTAVAQICGVQISTISKWRAGVSRMPHDAIIALADHFNCTTDEVLDRPVKPTTVYDVSAEHKQLNTAYMGLKKMYDERVADLTAARQTIEKLKAQTAVAVDSAYVKRLETELMQYQVTIEAVKALLKEK